MTFDKFTIKAQEVVQEALNTAQRSGQQSIEPMHLLKALLVKAKDVTTFIFQKLGVNAMQVESVADAELQRLPRVQGGQPYLSNDTNAVLQRAQDFAISFLIINLRSFISSHLKYQVPTFLPVSPHMYHNPIRRLK